jgi:ankyrin repeat protein
MSGSSGAKKQRTSSKDAKDDDAMKTLFDILNDIPSLIELIQQFLDFKETASFLQVLKLKVFKKIVDSDKNPSNLKVVKKTLDTFLEKCQQLYDLIERYKSEFSRGTPIVCACDRGRMNDVQSFVNLHPFHKYVSNREMNGYSDNMTLKEYVNQVGNARSGLECTPLMIVALNEHFQLVRYLIEQGADPNIAHSGLNALHWACTNGTNTEVIELLLTNMTLDSINKKSKAGYTPLDRAYIFNHSPIRQEVIALLRLKGGKGNRFDENGRNVGEGNGDLNQLLKF